MLFSGVRSFPDLTHRPSVVQPMPSLLAKSVPLIYASPASAARLFRMPFDLQA